MKDFIKKLILKLFKFGNALILEEKYNSYRNKYNLSASFRFNGDGILLYGNGVIEIGDKSYVGHNTFIQSKEGCKVVIGKGCSISHNVKFYTSTDEADQDFSITPTKTKLGNIVVGDYVWIGANAFISPGIKIGDNSIIGANSVVTKDVGSFEIVGGVPAKLIRKKRI